MNEPPMDDRELVAWSLRAVEEEPVGEHLDENTLALLEAGELSAAEHDAVVRHLGGCRECRELAVAAVGADFEEQPAAEVERAAPPPIYKRPGAWIAATLLAAAVCGLALFAQRPSPTERAFERGEELLAREEWEGASEQFQLLLREPQLSGEQLARAKEGCRRALREMAAGALVAEDFERVEQLRLEALALHVDSPAMASLHAQAVRQIPAPLALAHAGRLDDFGLALQGRVKSIPEEDPVTARARGLLEIALAEHGRDRELQLNLAHGWLQTDPERAATLFQQHLAEHAEDADAELGLGLARYLNADFAEAAEVFGRLVERNPGNHNARVNYAFALEDSGRTAEAVAQWRRVAEEHPDPEVRLKVTIRLTALPAGD